MNWLINIFDSIKWKIEDAVWSVKDKVQMWKLDREIAKEEYVDDVEHFEVEEIEVKPKKKKAKKKSAKKAKKSV